MSTPTSLSLRTFSERADGFAHFVLRAGEAPRLVAFDDSVGCPMDTALSALEWSNAIGLLRDDDMVHAAQLTSEVSIAVVERKSAEGREFLFLGPSFDAMPVPEHEGQLLIDEPGVRVIRFATRALALAHFLRTTGGVTGLLALLGRRGPEIRHLRRWLGPVIGELRGPGAMIGGWFAASSAGVLFQMVDDDDALIWRYIEVAIEP